MSKQTQSSVNSRNDLPSSQMESGYKRLRRIAKVLSARHSVGKARIVELCAFALFLPILGMTLFSQNPTGFASGFPWVIIGSVLFAARYGVMWGVSCALLTGLFINLPIAVFAQHSVQHLSLALGNIIICLGIGDATSNWRRRSQRAEAENHYLRHRLKEFSTDYHVLKVSHGQLEEHMAGQRLSLREALQQLQLMLINNNTSANGLRAGNELMALFSQFCSIQIAGLYAMNSEGKLISKAVATHGDMFELPLFDPLLRAAITERELVSIKLESLAENHHEKSLLAVLPLVDSEGHLHGVLAIKDMHFMAFQQQNLNLLALLGNYVGNLLTRSQGQADSRSSWFLAELDTALRFSQSHGIESTLLSIKFNSAPQSQDVMEFLIQSIRSLDASWNPPSEDGSLVLCLLLPLMEEAQAQAFLTRIYNAVAQQFEQSLNSMLTDIRLMQVKQDSTENQCLAFIAMHTGSDTLKRAMEAPEHQDESGVA